MKKSQTHKCKKEILVRQANKKHRRSVASKTKRKLKCKEYSGKTKYELKHHKKFSNYTPLTAPSNFSFIDKPEQTIEFINKLEKLYLTRKAVFVNLTDVQTLDYSAVTVLVSVMFSFKSRRIPFNGNFPKDKKLAQLLISSGFFRYLNKPIGEKLEYTLGKENQIFTRANKEVNSELGFVVMVEASKTIWGQKRTCKGLQRTLLELMQNTNNHAGGVQKGAKHWWLSVNHDKQNKKVSFVFVDYGIGIFESLKKKPSGNKWFGWFEKIRNELRYGGNDEVLNLLLNGQMHMTVTGQHFRGKGLPGIKEVFDRNQISNLRIISNNVYANVQGNHYYRLSNEFSGTFVAWELNEHNVNSKWII